jgi:dTDP-4-dehydrorhamnose reductase
LITGADGALAQAFAGICEQRDLAYRLCSPREMEICNPASVEALLAHVEPWAVVNATGFIDLDDAEHERDACYRDNVEGPAVLAAACAERGVALLTFSSDLVFGGEGARPYVESDPTRPLSVYAMSKAEAERRVLERLPSALVVRTGALFGLWDDDFVASTLRALDAATPFGAPCDQICSPTFAPDLVHASLDLLIDGERGVWHLANSGAVSWAELACRVAELAGLDPGLVEPCPATALGLVAPRPTYSVLGSERGTLLSSLEDALARHLAARTALTPVDSGR